MFCSPKKNKMKIMNSKNNCIIKIKITNEIQWIKTRGSHGG